MSLAKKNIASIAAVRLLAVVSLLGFVPTLSEPILAFAIASQLWPDLLKRGRVLQANRTTAGRERRC
jgi:hypothetical protein